MKRWVQTALVFAALTLLLCIGVFAADDGIYDIASSNENVVFQVLKSDKTVVPEVKGPQTLDSGTTAETNYYAGGEIIKVTVNNVTDGTYYLTIAQQGTALPTQDNAGNILYIDQVTAKDGTAEFTVYPSSLRGGDYHIFLASNDNSVVNGYTDVISFSYYVSYRLGYVNNDNFCDAADASLILQNAANMYTFTPQQYLAADVNRDTYADSSDASLILQYAANMITSFDKTA